MDKKKIKRIIAREGLILLGLALLSHILYNFEINQIAKYPVSPNFNLRHPFVWIYPLHLFIRFIIWAVRTLRKINMKKIINAVILLTFIINITGCAINTPHYSLPGIADSKEDLIAVEYFDMTHAENLYKGELDFSKIISEYLAGALQEKHFRAVIVKRQESQDKAEYRITGEITKIDPGSLAGRFWIAPGVGMARIAVSAVLTRISDNKELTHTKVTLNSSAVRGPDNILRYISGNIALRIANNFNFAINENKSSADEILKNKKLLDSGAITKEEYEQKKKQLLGL